MRSPCIRARVMGASPGQPDPAVHGCDRNERGQVMESTARKDSTEAALHRGPSLVMVAVVYVVLFIASVVVPTAMAGGQHYPSPFGPSDQAARYFGEHAGAVQLAAFLQLGSAIPLGIFAASASSRGPF